MKQLGKHLDNHFDKIFVINLDERTDRWDFCVDLFEKYGITNYERVSASKYTSLKELDISWYNRIGPFTQLGQYRKWLKFHNLTEIDIEKYLLGVSGCKMSHYRTLQTMKKRRYERVLILEDDIDIAKESVNEHTMNILTKSMNMEWDMLYLGGGGSWNWELQKIDDNIYKIIDRFIDAHAYGVSRRGVDDLLNKRENPTQTRWQSAPPPILQGMLNSGMEGDRFYEAVHKYINAYCIRPFIFFQKETFSNITNNIPPKGYTKS